jgi:hypothetical protein
MRVYRQELAGLGGYLVHGAEVRMGASPERQCDKLVLAACMRRGCFGGRVMVFRTGPMGRGRLLGMSRWKGCESRSVPFLPTQGQPVTRGSLHPKGDACAAKPAKPAAAESPQSQSS